MHKVLRPAGLSALLVAGALSALALSANSSPPCWSNSPHKECATTTDQTTTTTPATTSTTSTLTTTTSPPPSPYLFDDEFDGAAGSPPDATKWNVQNGVYYGAMSCSKSVNAFLDGQGHLVLRATREPAGWCSQDHAPFAGGSVGTYKYQTGWPPQGIKSSWPAGFRYEVRFKCSPVTGSGAWENAGWLQNVDRTSSQGLWELDTSEERTSPTEIGMNQHKWVGSTDVSNEGGGAPTTDCRSDWHTVTVDTYPSGGTKYYLDGVYVTTHSSVGGSFGVQIHNEIADVSAGIGQPAASDPGPWDMVVDYVRVTALP